MSELKLGIGLFCVFCVQFYRTLKPIGTKELFRQYRIGLDKAKAREELTDTVGDDDTFLYEACENPEIEAEMPPEEIAGIGQI